MPTIKTIKNNFQPILFITLAILVFLRYGNGYFIRSDSVGYFAYLPAIVIYESFDFSEFFFSCNHYSIGLTATGLPSNLWGCGTAIFWLPFFLLGYFFLSVTGSSLSSLCRYEMFYFTNFGTYLYGLFTLVLTSLVLKKIGLKKNIVFLVAVATLGTSLLFYMTFGGAMSHGVSAFTVSLFSWLCLSDRNKQGLFSFWFLLGLISGLMIIVRPTNLFYFALLLIPFQKYFPPPSFKKPENIKILSLFLVGLLLSILPQTLIWNKLYGSFLAFPRTGNLNFERFVLGEVLFSPLHGLLYWNPIVLVAILNYLFFGITHFRKAIALLGIGFFLQFFVFSFMEGWWSSYSFGHRLITDSFVPITIGLALPFLYVRSKKAKITFGVAYSLMAAWTLGLFMVYDLGRINIGDIVTPSQIFMAQGSLIKDFISTIKLIFSPPPIFWKGFFFLIFLSATGGVIVKKLRGNTRLLILSGLLFQTILFLTLSLKAYVATPDRYISDEEKQKYLLTKDVFKYANLHSRLFEIKYLIQMGRTDDAEKLLSLTKKDFYGTKAWLRWEVESKQKIFPENLTLQVIEKTSLTGT